MDLKELLPVLDDLDTEVIKNFPMVSDVLCAHINKRIDILNLLSEDLTNWTTTKLKKSNKWKIIEGGWVVDYPKFDRDNNLIKKFGRDIFDIGHTLEVMTLPLKTVAP